MGDIIFRESDHSYRDKDDKYISVTTLISRFHEKFDEDFWSWYKAYEEVLPEFHRLRKTFKYHLRKNTRSREFLNYLHTYVPNEKLLKFHKNEFIKKWNKERNRSLFKGTRYHLHQERKSNTLGEQVNPHTGKVFETIVRKPRKGADNYSMSNDLFLLPDGFYPELLLWNEDFLLAGQADKIFIETLADGSRVIDVGDYKTNKSLDLRSFQHPVDGPVMMYPPVSHLEDCNFNHYQLQLSTYAWMLEKFGFQVRSLTIHHANVSYPVKYLTREVMDMLTQV